MTTNASTTVSLAMITSECADLVLVQLILGGAPGPGWELTYGDDNYAMLQGLVARAREALGGSMMMEPTCWLNQSCNEQFFHFDLAVDDILAAEEASRRAVALVPAEQPGEEGCRVLIDRAANRSVRPNEREL